MSDEASRRCSNERMKSDVAIRRYRANLRLLLGKPCSCRGTAHDVRCQQGRIEMAAAERTLGWILDEYDELQEQVDSAERAARDPLNINGPSYAKDQP